MKQNKGFTLIELLIVIVLLMLIIGIAVPQVIKTFDYSKETAYNTLIEGIESSALAYISFNADNNNDIEFLYDEINNISTTTVSLQTLIDQGFYKGSIISPLTKKPLNSSTQIVITKDSYGYYSAKYNK